MEEILVAPWSTTLYQSPYFISTLYHSYHGASSFTGTIERIWPPYCANYTLIILSIPVPLLKRLIEIKWLIPTTCLSPPHSKTPHSNSRRGRCTDQSLENSCGYLLIFPPLSHMGSTLSLGLEPGHMPTKHLGSKSTCYTLVCSWWDFL